MLLRIALLGTLIVFVAPVVNAQTVYVDDMLRVGVRTQPRSGEAPISVVTTGAALEVLDHDGRYVRVRTQDGVEGWVNSVYVTDDPPARLRIGKVEKENSDLKQQLQALREKSAAALEENGQLHAKVDDLTARNSELQDEVSSETTHRVWGWLYDLGALAALFLLGFLVGLRRYKQRVAARFGGLEV